MPSRQVLPEKIARPRVAGLTRKPMSGCSWVFRSRSHGDGCTAQCWAHSYVISRSSYAVTSSSTGKDCTAQGCWAHSYVISRSSDAVTSSSHESDCTAQGCWAHSYVISGSSDAVASSSHESD